MIIDQIADTVREGLPERKKRIPQADLKLLAKTSSPSRDFKRAIQGPDVAFITEIKRASPSKGWLCPDLNVEELARNYTEGGASAISVLTEPKWFKGAPTDLATARRATHLPLLCKDFILDPYQVYEARYFGADAVLLITALLSLAELSALITIAHDLEMEALVEVHSEPEVMRAVEAKANVIGINNRDLTDFSVDLNTTLKLCPLIPSGISVVSESGIKSHHDIVVLQSAGISAVLIGETLVSSPDPEAKLRELMGKGRRG